MLIRELPVGSLVKDSQTIYRGDCIIFRILEHGHTGDPENSTTLECRDVLCLKAFDAKEPDNTDSRRRSYGNPYYTVSNLFQWLNSDEAGGEWYSPLHQYDHEPSSASYVGGYNEYSSEAGFLTFFSDRLKSKLLTTTKYVKRNETLDGGGVEAVSSKIFLLSNKEINLYDVENNETVYAYYIQHSENADRQKNLANEAAKGDNTNVTSPCSWWTIGADVSESYLKRYCYYSGVTASGFCTTSDVGVSPAFCVPQTLELFDEPDSDGVYVIQRPHEVVKFYVGINGKAVALPLKIEE